jgi:hypothetical protein
LFLASALAFAYRRPRAGGLLAGLAVASRPELLFVAIAAVLISLRHEESRHAVRRAAPVAGAVVMLIFAVTRTPIAVADGRLIWLLPVFLAVAGLVALAPAAVLRYATIAALAGTVLVLFSASGPHEVWHEDWPTILFGAAGVVLLVGNSRRSAVATFAVGLTVLLGGIYLLKNPSVARYFSLLIPLAAIAAGFAVASVPRHVRPVALGAVTLTVLFGFLHPVPGNRDYDMFRMVAGQVGPRLEARSLVTAAPDAYGFWLPGHPVRAMRKGARGAVLLDASQREYEPGLTAHGKVVARIGGDFALSRPNGDIDAAPVLLVAGRVIAEPSTRHGLSSTP